MTDYFSLSLSEREVNAYSLPALAHLGDAVYELLVRARLCEAGHTTAGALHRETVKYVSANAQAAAVARIADMLTEEESRVLRRGRNAKVAQFPRSADPAEYHLATGLEALLGYLYLRGEKGRICELFESLLGHFEGETDAD